MTSTQDVLVDGRKSGVLWAARGGGYTLRTGNSLIHAKIHHFSAAEGLDGVHRYLAERFPGQLELRAPSDE